jgi:hypothetical protein
LAMASGNTKPSVASFPSYEQGIYVVSTP